MRLQIGDSVSVKDGVKESAESDVDVSRWQGRVVHVLDIGEFYKLTHC